jgi:NADH-quinone oxidoreductase subunit E
LAAAFEGSPKNEIEKILGKYKNPSINIIQILQDIQACYNYIPQESVEYIAQRLHVPLSHIYSIATFYTAFSLKPKGKHICTVCMGTACHVRGATTILNELERRLGIAAGANTEDMEYTLETVNCLGCCAIAPIVVFDGKYHGGFKLGDISKLIKDR